MAIQYALCVFRGFKHLWFQCDRPPNTHSTQNAVPLLHLAESKAPLISMVVLAIENWVCAAYQDHMIYVVNIVHRIYEVYRICMDYVHYILFPSTHI